MNLMKNVSYNLTLTEKEWKSLVYYLSASVHVSDGKHSSNPVVYKSEAGCVLDVDAMKIRSSILALFEKDRLKHASS